MHSFIPVSSVLIGDNHRPGEEAGEKQRQDGAEQVRGGSSDHWMNW